MERGYFKFYRSILESRVFAHPVALKIWVWCLAKANFRDKYVPLKVGKGTTTIHVKAGQFLFGRFKAEEELGIDGSTIYNWMQRFASEAFEKMIALESNNQYTVVTISNWASYQEEKPSEVTTNEQPMNNQVTTVEQPSNTTKKEKKVNNDNKIKEGSETAKRFQPPTQEEVQSYVQSKGYSVDAEAFIAFYTSKGWMIGNNKMKDWRSAVVTWSKKDRQLNKSQAYGHDRQTNGYRRHGAVSILPGDNSGSDSF